MTEPILKCIASLQRKGKTGSVSKDGGDQSGEESGHEDEEKKCDINLMIELCTFIKAYRVNYDRSNSTPSIHLSNIVLF